MHESSQKQLCRIEGIGAKACLNSIRTLYKTSSFKHLQTFQYDHLRATAKRSNDWSKLYIDSFPRCSMPISYPRWYKRHDPMRPRLCHRRGRQSCSQLTRALAPIDRSQQPQRTISNTQWRILHAERLKPRRGIDPTCDASFAFHLLTFSIHSV